MLKKTLLVMLSLAFLASSAEAALLSNVDGNVLVKKGRGYRKVSKTTRLKPGDRVFVRGEGSARVTYGANCSRTVVTNQAFVVPPGAECMPGDGPQMADQTCSGPGCASGMTDADKFVLGTFVVGGGFIAATRDHSASP